ncbi:MAG: AMP-binding protein [Eubacteriales bacterium]
MQNNVLEYLEHTVKRIPNKVAYANEQMGVTFLEIYDQARSIGTFLSEQGIHKQPVVVFMNKQPKTIVAFLGVIYGGNFYVPLDEEMPRFRIELILKNLNPKIIICDEKTQEIMKTIEHNGEVYLYENIIKTVIDMKVIYNIRNTAIDTDPIYIVFTSGSTGKPKGVIACHRSVIDYIETISELLELNENTVFGMQVPLYFDACLKEVYPTLKFGASTYLVPKNLFMFPIKLVEFLNTYHINTICWVVSALTIISAFGALEKIVPRYLRTIAFGSEIFPIKQFNIWKQALPNAKYINLYGPTEATGMCCYYRVDREFEEGDVLPIGKPFKNTEIILLNQQNKMPHQGEIGEICIRGTSLTLGYYKAFDKTNEVFVQNPLNDAYPELIYRTGDLGKYNDKGELVFVSRKDYQIKHMGHRIELDEIEVNVNIIEGIKSACCIYDKEKGKIVLYYVGDLTSKEIISLLRKKLPRYMIPNHTVALDMMPLTANGKIHRTFLNNHINKNEKGEI